MVKKNEKEGKKKDIFDLLHGSEIVVQADTGVMYEGKLAGVLKMGQGTGNAFLILTDAIIRGRKHVAKVHTVVISMKRVVHFNTAPISLEEIKEQ